MVIALTGGICCGKSTVLKALENFGYRIYDVDNIAHEVSNEKDIACRIKQEISATVFCYNKIDRKKLAKIVFNDEDKRKKLNEIVHPRIIYKMLKIIEENKEKSEITFIEVPLLYELNLQKYFDKVILIYVDRLTQIERIMLRDKKTKKEAINILNTQIDIEEKKKKTKYVLLNYDLDKLETNLKSLIERIKNEY